MPLHAEIKTGGIVSPFDGQSQVQVPIPERLKLKNTGGSDGAGLCVFTSVNVSALLQLENGLYRLRDQMTSQPGGGWPEKLDQMIAKFGGSSVDYAQYQGRDTKPLRDALASGRSPAVTYSGRDPHYSGYISHMVNLVGWTDSGAVCIADNNFVAADQYVWMSEAEFLERWAGKGSGWAVILLRDPPDELATYAPPNDQAIGSGSFSVTPPAYRWYVHKLQPQYTYLYRLGDRPGANAVGCWDPSIGQFQYFDRATQTWLAPTSPPFTPPASPVMGQQAFDWAGPVVTDYGVDLAMFPFRNAGEDSYTRKGQKVDGASVLAMLTPKKKADQINLAGFPETGALLLVIAGASALLLHRP